MQTDGEFRQEDYAPLVDGATRFITSFRWCRRLADLWVGDAIPRVVGVFLAHIEPGSEEVDEWLWVVVGDLPPAYLVIDSASTPREALQAYIEEMRSWVEVAKAQGDFSDVIPVAVPPTEENIAMLESRLDFLERRVVPDFEG